MSTNQDERSMITYLAKGDFEMACKYARVIALNDHTEKNKSWREKTIQALEQAEMKGMTGTITLPSNIARFCELYQPDDAYFENRYLLPEAEREVLDQIIRKQETCSRMKVLGVPVSNTVILYGAPGVGKTEFARYLSYCLKKPLLCIRLSQIIDSYLGQTANNIGQIFDFFHKQDVILFLDEIDTIANRRNGSGGADSEISRVTASVMQELDRTNGDGVIIAATNRLDILDEALLRRFTICHEMKPMGESDRVKLAEKFWASVCITPPDSVLEYAKENHTASEITTNNVFALTKYLQEHPEDTPLEQERIMETIVSENWLELFLRVSKEIEHPELSCRELEKNQYEFNRIANYIPISVETVVCRYSDGVIDFAERTDAYRYSVFICRSAWQERFGETKDVTLGELSAWARQELKRVRSV